MEGQRDKRPGETTFGIILLLLGVILLWQAYEISGFSALSSPGAFPLAAAAVMVIASVIVVIGDVRRRGNAKGELTDKARAFSAQITPAVVVIFAGFVIGYAALLNALGFLPASFLFLFAAIYYLHRGSLAFSFAVSLCSLILIYVIFRLVFQVVLPEGIVPEREIMAIVTRFFGFGGAE